MAPARLNLKKILKEPFGPYPDAQILNDEFPPRGFVPCLKSVWMDCADQPIGLDESEFIITPPSTSRVAQHPVRFFGILELDSLDWLSELGRKWLELDLRQRDRDIHLEHMVSGLTLNRLYGDRKDEGSRISVWVQCERSLLAQFLTSNTHPKSLLFHSKEKDRMFEILSLDVGTYEKSQNFLSRYRLWTLIRAIVDTDPEQTPLERRTIDYFVDQYLARFRESERHHRLIFDSINDTDVDALGNTKKPRYLRHVPRSEVIGVFASQAEWLLAHQLAPSGRQHWRTSIREWISFCRRAKHARREARLDRVRWGTEYAVDSDADDDDDDSDLDLSKFGETPEFWAKKLKLALAQKPRAKPNRRIESSPSSDIEIVERQRPSTTKNVFVYDSDFSEASTLSAPESDSDASPCRDPKLPVPPYLLERPEIPSGRFAWRCPGCVYTIDFLKLMDENTKDLPHALATVLKGRSWTYLKEGPVQLAFFKMVSDHYRIHLHENGVRIVQKGGKHYLEKWEQAKIHG